MPRGQPVDISTLRLDPSLKFQATFFAAKSGYIQSLDLNLVGEALTGQRACVQFDRPVGSFVLENEPVGRSWSVARMEDRELTAIAAAYAIGQERTPEQDIEFGFRRLADIAVKALSSAINDPTTAIGCIDQLCAALLLVAKGSAPAHRFRILEMFGDAGKSEVIWEESSFERYVTIAFDQIRMYGAADPWVMSHLVTMLGRVAKLVDPQLQTVLATTANQARDSALLMLAQPTDRGRIEAAAAWLDQFAE